MRPATFHLTLAIWFLSNGTMIGQDRDIRALITSDPATVDTDYPPGVQGVTIPSGDTSMNGVFYTAQGRGPHATLIMLHGMPGYEWNSDLAHAVRRIGFNVLMFRYRGTWGSGGSFSPDNALEDARAALRFLRGEFGLKNRVDATRIAIYGHSYGAWASLITASIDSGVCAVAASGTPIFYERQTTAPAQPTVGPVRRSTEVTQPTGLPSLDVRDYTSRLATFDILLIVGKRDKLDVSNHEVLVTSLKQSGAKRTTAVLLDTDHNFQSARIAVADALARWLIQARLAGCRN
jgi:alpha/beta superfamily hydrolase